MPCKCCSNVPPPKGIKLAEGDQIINHYLKLAVIEIKKKYVIPYDNTENELLAWENAWIEAFEHHLKGCPKKNNESL